VRSYEVLRILPEDGQVMFTCEDCGQKYPQYLVRDEVWELSGRIGWNSGNLCQPCLGKAIGRPIQKRDLLSWPVNISAAGYGLYAFRHEYIDRCVNGRGY
jgi:hypothetical protein